MLFSSVTLGICCGQPYAEAVFAQLSPTAHLDWQVKGGA